MKGRSKNIEFWNVFKFKFLSTYTIIYIGWYVCEPHVNNKAKTYSKYTKENYKTLNIKLKVINPQGKSEREERNREELQKQPENKRLPTRDSPRSKDTHRLKVKR